MSDEANGQSTETAAPAPGPAPTAEEIQAMVDAQVSDAVSRRIPGLQSAYEKQIAGLRDELKKATADPDRYEASASSRLEQELAAARQEAEALRIARQYPEVFPVYEAVLGASTPQEQLDVLQAFVQGASSAPAQNQQTPPPASPQEPAANPVPPPVDLNRAPQSQGGSFGAPADAMDQSLADRIIDGVGDFWPGS